MPPDLGITAFAGSARQFKLGKEVEDRLSQAMAKIEKQGQQPDPEAARKKAEAEEIARAGAQMNVEGRQIDNAKKTAEVEKTVEEVNAQRVETALMAMTPVVPVQEGGFVA